jgi:hypothetical protein
LATLFLSENLFELLLFCLSQNITHWSNILLKSADDLLFARLNLRLILALGRLIFKKSFIYDKFVDYGLEDLGCLRWNKQFLEFIALDKLLWDL